MLLKRVVKLLCDALASKYPKYNLDSKKIDNIVKSCALYNVGSIAISKDSVITSDSIKEEIEYGNVLLKNYIKDEAHLKVASNIVNYSFEMYNGSGYPNALKENDIPIEAQLTSISVRIVQYSLNKSFNIAIKNILMVEDKKYNPDILDVIKDMKKELKDLF